MKTPVMAMDEQIAGCIFLIRGQKVMLDRDLAELYGVETKVLKQAVKRNIDRFPEDFMFEMTEKEMEEWKDILTGSTQKKLRSQFVTSNRGGLRYKPFCFTEQGVAMLSSVLKSERAISVNIQIIRIFTRMRQMLLNHKDILLKLEILEKKVSGHDRDIHLIFNAIKQLLQEPKQERRPIGFKRS